MSSAIHDLQKAILAGQLPLTQLLRQTKLIAAKLDLDELERWVDLELNGYPPESEPPKYREFWTYGLEYHNPYQGGWQFAGNLNYNLKARQPIAEIERMSQGTSVIAFPMPKNYPLTDFTGDESILSSFPQRLTVACSQYKGIVDGLTNELLRLTAELEKQGIKGENMSFNEREKSTASGMVFNIGTVQGAVGNVSNSPVTFYDNKTVNQLFVEKNIPKKDRRELEDILDELKTAEPEKRKSLVTRAEELIVKHKEALGAAAEIIIKSVKAAME